MSVNTYSLISLDSVKDFIGLKGAVTDSDDLLSDLINRVSIMIESYCDRQFLSREYTEYHDGKKATKLFTNQYPVTAITSIHDDSEWVWPVVDLIDSDSYRIANENTIIFRDVTLGNFSQNIKIIYTAGYISTPHDLEQTCVEEVSRIYKNRNQIDVASKSLSDGSVSFITSDLLDKTHLVLNKYKRKSGL